MLSCCPSANTSHLSLFRQRKVTQRKATPANRPPLAGARSGSGVFDGTSLSRRKHRPPPCGRPFGLIQTTAPVMHEPKQQKPAVSSACTSTVAPTDGEQSNRCTCHWQRKTVVRERRADDALLTDQVDMDSPYANRCQQDDTHGLPRRWWQVFYLNSGSSEPFRWSNIVYKQNAFILAALLLVAPGFSDAVCASRTVAVSGKVLNRLGQPIHGAIVGVSWTRDQLPQGPALAISGPDGSFLLQFQFNTFTKNSLFRGDVCNERLDTISVSAAAPGLRSEYLQAPVVDWHADINLVVDPYGE